MNPETRKQLLALAAHFLREYAERLGNGGCDDWQWPYWLSAEARTEIIRASESHIGEFHYVADEVWGPPNWMAAERLADFLEGQG